MLAARVRWSDGYARWLRVPVACVKDVNAGDIGANSPVNVDDRLGVSVVLGRGFDANLPNQTVRVPDKTSFAVALEDVDLSTPALRE